jgi:TPR repeat protein
LFHIFEKLGVSNRFELLFWLFKECNAQATGPGGIPFGAELSHSIDTYVKAAEEGSVAAQFLVGLAHLEGSEVEKNELSAFYWLRLAEENSGRVGERSHAIVEQLRNTVKADEIDHLEQRIAIAVQNNELLKRQTAGRIHQAEN